MPCYNPLRAWRSRHLNENGKRPIVWKERDSDGEGEVKLKCGKCLGCRLDYSREWALRCHHEAEMHEDNSFVTLTFRDKDLPEDNSIRKEHLQNFFKKLRRELQDKYGRLSIGDGKFVPVKKIKYFACGEYGDENLRPHYHAIIFGYGFPDKILHSKKNGNLLYRSEFLERCWEKGYSTIGNVTFESAAYVARYVMKKRKGDREAIDKKGMKNKHYYERVDRESGEIVEVEPEFCLMSRRPGIGKIWLDKYKGDVYKDYVTLIDGSSHKLPRYYDNQLEKKEPIRFIEMKEARKEKIDYENGTMERLRQRERVKEAQIDSLVREL